MPGRKPKPQVVKLLQGTFRKHRANLREPNLRGDLYSPPEKFSAAQTALWNYAIENAPPGLLKLLDLSVLETWVTAYVFYREAVEDVKEKGQVLKAPNGYAYVNPMLANVNKQAMLMLRAAAEMGFTPSSRSRIVMPEEAEEADPWAKMAVNG